METQSLITKALLDSRCTRNTINHVYVQKHQINMKKAVVPILVYNTDRFCNKVGNITE